MDNNAEYKYSNGIDFYLGAITEFYFLPIMGIAIGGGVTPGLSRYDQTFTPYIRVQIPFLFSAIKLGLSFDYILWDGSVLPRGADAPFGYRTNILVNVRGVAAARLFTMWF